MLLLVTETIRLQKRNAKKSYILHLILKLDAATKFHKYSLVETQNLPLCSPEMSSKMTHLHFILISDQTIQ